jgi:uncharacterized damage-inducible protein DinB
MTLLNHFHALLRYDLTATARTIASIRSAPSTPPDPTLLDPRGDYTDTAHPLRRAVAILGHIASARHVWLARLGGVAPRPFVMWPTDPLSSIEADHAHLDTLWQTHLATLADAALDREVRYSSVDGHPFVSTGAEIITHALNHATYHRGQIATLVTKAGGTRAQTDYIALTRRPG